MRRSDLFLVLVIVATLTLIGLGVGAGYQWYQATHAPSQCSESRNRLFEIGQISTAVPQFMIGSYSAYSEPPTIAYLVRIDNPKQLGNPHPWLRSSGGQVFVKNRLVARKRGILQLLIDNGSLSPLRIEIPIERALPYFGRDAKTWNHFDHVKEFWDKVLRADQIFASTRESAITIERFAGDNSKSR